MRWPFVRGEPDSLQDSGGVSVDATTERHRSPGLGQALSHLQEDRPCSILDLGPALPENVEFFSRYRCRLSIVDLFGRINDESDGVSRLERAPEAILDDFLPTSPRPYDLILSWNVFDHIGLEVARSLVVRLARMTSAGARLHAIISSSVDAETRGLTFAICQPDTLEYRPALQPERRAIPFNPAALAKLLEGFFIDHSVVLRHGFQEYVAVRAEGATMGTARNQRGTFDEGCDVRGVQGAVEPATGR